jgi:hypothetical protein
MVDAVECRRQVRVKYPCAARVLPLSRLIDGLDRIMAATARPESIGSRFEPCFPLGFQRVDGQSLKASVGNHGNSERALSPIGLPDVHTLDGVWSPRVGPVLQPVDQVSLGLWQRRDLAVDPGRRAPSVDLRYSPDADLRVGVGAEVGSDRGAVLVSRPVRFPGPPAAPGVPLSRHRALHVSHSLVSP